MDDNIKIRCNRNPWQDTIELAIVSIDFKGKAFVAQPLAFQNIDEGNFICPFITIKAGEAQQLMDELWNCGLRPSKGSGSAGSLKATEKHLADMQKLAFMTVEKIINKIA